MSRVKNLLIFKIDNKSGPFDFPTENFITDSWSILKPVSVISSSLS